MLRPLFEDLVAIKESASELLESPDRFDEEAVEPKVLQLQEKLAEIEAFRVGGVFYGTGNGEILSGQAGAETLLTSQFSTTSLTIATLASSDFKKTIMSTAT